MPTCGCGGVFTVPELRDLERIDPDGFDELVGSLSLRAGNAAMRELGYVDAVVRRGGGRPITTRCVEDGCGMLRVSGSKLCRKHEKASVPF